MKYLIQHFVQKKSRFGSGKAIVPLGQIENGCSVGRNKAGGECCTASGNSAGKNPTKCGLCGSLLNKRVPHTPQKTRTTASGERA